MPTFQLPGSAGVPPASTDCKLNSEQARCLRSRAAALIAVLALGTCCSVQPPAQAAQRQFKQALPGYTYSFPRDHASHEDYKTEWWYYTGHLQAPDGRRYGYELTFFRSAMNVPDGVEHSPWTVDNVYLTHFAVSDIPAKNFFYKSRLNRSGIDFAGASTKEYRVWNQDWHGELVRNSQEQKLHAAMPDYTIDLSLKPDKPPVVHGENGVSQKASCAGCASHYYSYTRLLTKGRITIHGRAQDVTGLSWMDHEFGSNQLTKEQVGWDWYSVQLNDKVEIMLYIMRLADGSIDVNSSGTLVYADGSARHLKNGQYSITPISKWVSPHTHAVYPMGWHVSVPSIQGDLTIKPEMEDQELAKRTGNDVSYWEGACDVDGRAQGKPVSGQAYVELTGYGERFNKNI